MSPVENCKFKNPELRIQRIKEWFRIHGHPSKGKKLSKEHIQKRSESYRRKFYGNKSVDKNGYIAIKMPDHPNARKSTGLVYEHRVVMSNYLGRPLKRYEQVHHINGIKSDNRIENLKLFQNNKEHHDYHWKEIRMRKFCCPDCGKQFNLQEVSQCQ